MNEFVLSRIQFGANVTFHILFPTITIALGWVLLFFKIRHHLTGEDKWMRLYFFFTKVFALSFSLGVVSGVTMSFQFGTNWPGFMNTVGNIAGPLLAYEVLTAFFLEATFLGIMLFGFRRVPGWLHTGATFLVAAGTTLSAFWILALNSWMQTPAGFKMVDGVARAANWAEVVLTPSMPYRFTHTLLSSALTVAFLIGGLMAFRRLRGDQKPEVETGIRVAVVMALIFAPLQLVAGDLHGINTRDHQPAKLAAMEGHWRTEAGAPLLLFALPDQEARENKMEIGIPKLGSLIVTRNPEGVVRGLEEFGDKIPPVAPVFWSFRVMVGIGLLMILFGMAGGFFLWRKMSWPRWFLLALVGMTFSGWVATVAGWYVTEIGRQPWLVQGVLLTKDAVAALPPAHVGVTLAAYLVTYAILTGAYVLTIFYMAWKQSCDGGGRAEPAGVEQNVQAGEVAA